MFVCTGNICRSAMADAYLKYLLKKFKIEDKVEVASCGIEADTGDTATKYAMEVISCYGANLEKHKARNIHKFNLKDFDKILVMTVEHKRRVCEMAPELTDRIELLKKYMKPNASEYMNIDDPWGLSLEVYKNCAAEIVNCVDNLVKKLLEEGG